MTRTNRVYDAVLRASCAIVALSLSGCATRVGDLTLISTKNIDLSDARINVKEGKRTEGKDCAYAILGLLPLGIPNLERAVDDALQKGNGNVMVDQVTYQEGAYFILASQSCIKVEGTVLNVATGAARQ